MGLVCAVRRPIWWVGGEAWVGGGEELCALRCECEELCAWRAYAPRAAETCVAGGLASLARRTRSASSSCTRSAWLSLRWRRVRSAASKAACAFCFSSSFVRHTRASFACATLHLIGEPSCAAFESRASSSGMASSLSASSHFCPTFVVASGRTVCQLPDRRSSGPAAAAAEARDARSRRR